MPQIKQADATFIITKTPSKYITADIGKLTIIADNVSLATFGTSHTAHQKYFPRMIQTCPL